MFLKHIDLTTALRPSYLPDEILLFVQDNVGLYEGKYKLPDQQSGQVYLTSHRICYVDKDEPRSHSVALDLKEVDRHEFYAGFLKSSPKITIVPKPPKLASLHKRAASNAASHQCNELGSVRLGKSSRPRHDTPAVSSATWVCTICSFSNPVPSHFDPTSANAHTPLAPCLACGIKPTLGHILKAAITNANNRSITAPSSVPGSPLPFRQRLSDSRLASEDLSVTSSSGWTSPARQASEHHSETVVTFNCPRCTFENHPSLLSCEICGASLVSQEKLSTDPYSLPEITRTDSPGPVADTTNKSSKAGVNTTDSIKISFRGGGEKIFYERLKGSMTQRKWLLQNAPPPPRSNRDDSLKNKGIGIAGLEQLGMTQRKNNEFIIGNAFEDLEALMASAKDVVALAERLARQNNEMSSEENAILAESASQLGLIATKDIVASGSSLYLSELSRNLAEFLTDDCRGVLKKAGGIITLVDLWAMFNRSRGGVELVSPMDFDKAARMWETLKLPVRLRTFRSGVMVVQGRDRTDESTLRTLRAWLQDLHEFPPEREVTWDWQEFGRGVTAQDAAERFGWSLGVAEEELLMAEEAGAVCREEGLEGLKFWVNYIGMGDTKSLKSNDELEQECMMQGFKSVGLV